MLEYRVYWRRKVLIIARVEVLVRDPRSSHDSRDYSYAESENRSSEGRLGVSNAWDEPWNVADLLDEGAKDAFVLIEGFGESFAGLELAYFTAKHVATEHGQRGAHTYKRSRGESGVP